MQDNPSKHVVDTIDAASAELREISLKIHDKPELGFKEVFAHKTLTDYLLQKGFQVTKHACGLDTAFIAEFVQDQGEPDSAHQPLPSVGFCSEFDALPGIGHGCGHNLIAISGLAAVVGVKTAMEKSQIRGRVRLLGTPGEETLGGKIPMIEQGALEGLDACMMVHPGQWDILYRQPLGVGRLEVEYHGKAAHASTSPWEGKNALDAMCMAYNAIGLLRQQTLPTNRIHSIIKNGGQASNIVPELVTASVMYRANKQAELVHLHDQIVEILESAAVATGCTVKIEKAMEYLPLNNNSLLTDRFGSYMTSMGAHLQTRDQDEATPAGSTDMGNITVAAPGCHPVFNIASLDSSREPGLSTHSALFAERARTELAHETVIRAAKALALTGLDVLTNAEYTKNVRKEFEASKGTPGK